VVLPPALSPCGCYMHYPQLTIRVQFLITAHYFVRPAKTSATMDFRQSAILARVKITAHRPYPRRLTKKRPRHRGNANLGGIHPCSGFIAGWLQTLLRCVLFRYMHCEHLSGECLLLWGIKYISITPRLRGARFPLAGRALPGTFLNHNLPVLFHQAQNSAVHDRQCQEYFFGDHRHFCDGGFIGCFSYIFLCQCVHIRV